MDTDTPTDVCTIILGGAQVFLGGTRVIPWDSRSVEYLFMILNSVMYFCQEVWDLMNERLHELTWLSMFENRFVPV